MAGYQARPFPSSIWVPTQSHAQHKIRISIKHSVFLMNTSWLLYQYPFLSKVGQRWVVPAAPCHLFQGLENSLSKVELTTIRRESVFWLKPSLPGLSLVKTVQLAEDRRGKTIKEEKKEGPFAPIYMCTHMHCTHTHTHTYKQKTIVQRKRGEKR